nr:unnamed protein product [Digitaria exilis]
MRAAARVRRPRPLPEPARPSVSPAARANTEKAPIPLNLPLKAFKLRLANGAPLAPTANAFKSYAETCASLLRLCRHTAADASNLPSFSVSSALQLVLSLHAHALRSGLGSDCSVASNLLTAYAAFGRSVDRDRAFDDCVTSGAASSFVYDFMVSEHVKAGDIASARRLFDGMPVRSVVSYTTMVDALMKRGSVRDAVELYEQCEFDLAMSVIGLAIKWNLFEKSIEVHNSLITLYLRMGDAAAARRVFDEMEVRDVVSWTALLDVYAELGDLEGARRILDAMPERNAVSWGTLIARHEQKEMGKMVHAKIVKLGIEDDIFLGTALSDIGLVEQAIHYFEKMHTHGIPPKEKHYTCMVDVLARAGRLKEAEELLMKVPSNLEANSWSALLSACNTYSNKEIGERAAKRLHELEKDNTAGYVLLSNIELISPLPVVRWSSAAMEPLEVAITIIFDALLLVFMVKLFFAMFQMKLVVILFYLVILLFAMAFSGRAPSSF